MRHQQHACKHVLTTTLLGSVTASLQDIGTAAHAVQRELTNANPTLLGVALCTATRVACNAGSFIKHAGHRASAT